MFDKKKLIFLLIPVVAVVIFLSKFNTNSRLPGATLSPLPTGGSIPVTPAPESKGNLPIASSHPNVMSVLTDKPGIVSYVFSGTIKNVESVSMGSELVLETKGGPLPTFKITKDTRSYRATKPSGAGSPTFEAASQDIIQEGHRADISIVYNLTEKKWSQIADIFVY